MSAPITSFGVTASPFRPCARSLSNGSRLLGFVDLSFDGIELRRIGFALNEAARPYIMMPRGRDNEKPVHVTDERLRTRLLVAAGASYVAWRDRDDKTS